MADLACSDPDHALRSGQSDWGISGTVGGSTVDYLCGACHRARTTDVTSDTARARTFVAVENDGTVRVGLVRKNEYGRVLGVREAPPMTAAEIWTAAERTTLRDLLAKAVTAARARMGS